MTTLTIRNLDDAVITHLRDQAKANQRSLEGEIRFILARSAGRAGAIKSFRERTEQLLAEDTAQSTRESVALLREDRDR